MDGKDHDSFLADVGSGDYEEDIKRILMAKAKERARIKRKEEWDNHEQDEL